MGMSRRKVSTTVYLDSSDLDRLKVISEKTRVPMAVYIRDAVRAALDAHDLKLPETPDEND